VVLIDSLTELIDLVEGDNDISKAKYALRWLKKIRRRYDTAIILIHHNRKATEGNKKPKGLADLEGSFNLGRACDSAIQMWEDGSKGIELSGVKVRYGQKSAFYIRRNENLWFERTEPLPDSSDSRSSSTTGQDVLDESSTGSSYREIQQDHKSDGELDAGNGPKSVQSDTFGITGFQSDFG
jgi:RecA-family ATPase